jgi:uncharacterized membrane protein YiaA
MGKIMVAKKKADKKAEVAATSKKVMQWTIAKQLITVETLMLRLWNVAMRKQKVGELSDVIKHD